MQSHNRRSVSLAQGAIEGRCALSIALLTAFLLLVGTAGASAAYVDPFNTAPFTGTVTSFTTGSSSTGMSYAISGGDGGDAKLVTSIEITTTDFYDDYLDTVSLELDVPGAAVYGESQLITNGDSSPSATDGTDLGETPVTQDFELRNVGDAALTVGSSVTVTGAGFSIAQQPSSPIASGGSSTFTVQFDPTSSGTVTGTVTIDNNSEADDYTFAVTGEGTADTDPPVLTAFERQTPTLQDTNADSLVFRATFDEDVQYITAGDFAVTGTSATVTNVSTVSAAVYDLTVSGGDLAGYDGAVGLNLSGTQNIADLWDNALPAGEPATDETYEMDNTPPIDPTPSSASHNVSVWDNDNTIDIQISGASDAGSGVDGFEVEWDQLASWTPSGTKEQEETWTGGTFTATSDGNWYFHIATVDNVGNWTSTEHLGPFQIDTTPPSVPAGLDPSDGSTTTDTSPVLSWNASTDTGGSGIRDTAAYRVVVTGPVNRDTYVSDTDYNPTLSEGTFSWKVYARDNAGNSSSYTADTALVIDATQPDVAIDQAGGQADPTNVSPVVFTAMFDEPIDESTFTGVDVSIGGTATTGTVTVTEVAPHDGTTFEASIAVTGDGTVVPTIPAGRVEDFAGNTNTVSTSPDNSVTYDGSKPSVTIDQAAGQADPTNASPVLFTVVFDEPINDATFTNTDVSVGGTATTGLVTVIEVAPNDDTTFEVSIAVTGDGTVVPTIPAGSVEDAAGNTNNASTSTDNSVRYDGTSPWVGSVSVNIAQLSDADSGAGTFVVSAYFSEELGVMPSIVFDPDVAAAGTPTLSLASADWDDMTNGYSVTYDVADQGVDFDSVTIDVVGAQDLAGNAQQDYTPEHEFEIDTLNPTAVIWLDDTLIMDADVGGFHYLELSFSEDMDTTCGWPTWSFAPNVTTNGGTWTLGHTTPAGWTSSTSFHRNYAVFDTNDPYKSVDMHLETAYDLAGNLIEPSPTVNSDAFVVDTENPTVANVVVSDDWLDALDDGETFMVTVDFSEAMTTDGSADPTIAFTPNVATTLTISTEAWIDGDTWEVVYDVADTNAVDLGVDVRITGGKDAVGNAQVALDDPDRFDIDMVTPPPGTLPTIVVTPAGAAGDGAFLDRCLSLDEGEEPPMVGLCPLSAIYSVGEIISGRCLLSDDDGTPLRGSYVHVYVYAVDPSTRPETLVLIDHWTIHYEGDCGGYCFTWDSSEQFPGYYDVRLSFPDASAHTCRIQLTEPTQP